jgi:branched-chain amino acid transport system substrate-binding protein
MKFKLTMTAAAALVTIATAAAAETRGVTKTEIILGMHTDLSGVAATYGVRSMTPAAFSAAKST